MYGSLNNMLAGSDPEIVPKVGMGATMIGWTDRHAYTVVEVKSARHVVVQRDAVKRVDMNGISESQRYEFSADPEGEMYEVTRRKNGRWVIKGESMKNGTKFVIGHREEYFDYSF